MTNIVQMPTPKHVLFERYRAGYKRAEGGRIEWITGILEMAAALCELRDQFNNDQAFSLAIAEAGLGFHNDDDRAALINMQRNRVLTEIVLQETKRTSLQLIWREEIQPRVRNATKPPAEPAKLPEPPNPAAPVANNDEPPAQKPDGTRPAVYAMRKRAVYAKAPRAAEIHALFTHDGRDVLTTIWKHRNHKQVWNLMVTAFDAGLLVANTAALKQPTLRLLFPLMPNSYSQKYNLFNKVQRERVRAEILPAMIACKDKLFADPENTQTIVTEYLKEQHVQQKQAMVAEKHAVAVKAMAAIEQELVMFEQPVWPRPDNSQGEYSYDQARAAIWFFREYLDSKALTREDTKSFTIRVRNSLRYLNEYIKRTERNNPMAQIFMLVFWFSYLMEKNPVGECKWPMYPHIEGQW